MYNDLLGDVEVLLDRYGNPEDRRGGDDRLDLHMYYSQEANREENQHNVGPTETELQSQVGIQSSAQHRTGAIPKSTRRSSDIDETEYRVESGAQSLEMMRSTGYRLDPETLVVDQQSNHHDKLQSSVRMGESSIHTPLTHEPLLSRRKEEFHQTKTGSDMSQLDKMKDEINQYIQNALSQQMSALMNKLEPLINQRSSITPPPPPPTPPSVHGSRRSERYPNSVASRVSEAEDFVYHGPSRPLGGGSQNRWQVPANKWRIYFSGDNRGPTVTQFLNRVEILARNNNVSEHELLSQANFFFKEGSEAEEWYYTFCQKFNSWTTFKHQLRLRFEQPNKDNVIERQILDRRQLPHETFNAFMTAIEKLVQQLTKSMPEARKLEILMENMKDCYKPFLTMYRIERIEDLVAICHSLDRSMYRSYANYSRNRSHHVNMLDESEEENDQEKTVDDELNAISQVISRKKMTEKAQKEQMKSTEDRGTPQAIESEGNILCWNCRQFGHFWRNCSKSKKIFCHFCGNMNYVVSNCPGNHRFNSSENENTGRS